MNSLWFTSRGWKKHRCQANTGCCEQYYLSLHFICRRCKIPFLTLSKCAPINILLANYTVSFDDEKIWCPPFYRSRRPSFAKLRCSRIQRPDFPISHRNKLFWRRIYSWPRFLCIMSMNLTPYILINCSRLACPTRLESEQSIGWFDWIWTHFGTPYTSFRRFHTWPSVALETDWENFNFLHLEMLFASEHLITIQPRVIPIRMSKICETGRVFVAGITTKKSVPPSNLGPYEEWQ
jgi:hypothetical protein